MRANEELEMSPPAGGLARVKTRSRTVLVSGREARCDLGGWARQRRHT